MTITTNTLPAVVDYETGERLPGAPSQALIRASREEHSGTGAVAAYYEDTSAEWDYVPDSDVARLERGGTVVVTVYIED